MLELPHTLVGAAIAVAIPNPLISLPLALASHFITDYVPHWNPHLHTEKTKTGKISKQSLAVVITDATLALIIGTYIATTHNNFVTIMLACFLSVAPDVLEIPYYFLHMDIPWIKKLITFQRTHQWNVPAIWGIFAQILIGLTSLAIIYFTRSA